MARHDHAAPTRGIPSTPLRALRNPWASFCLGLLVGTFGLAPMGYRWLEEDSAVNAAPAETLERQQQREAEEASLSAAIEEVETATVAAFIAPSNNLVTGKIKPNQFVADILTNAGATLLEADQAIRALTGTYDFRKSRPGHQYELEVSPQGEVLRFRYKAGPDEAYLVTRSEEGKFVGKSEDIKLERTVVEVDGTIKVSLWEAFIRAGESPNLAMTLAEVFQYDIDFFHDTRKNDRFRFWVEKFTNEGELVRYGRIYAAEYIGSSESPIGAKKLFYWDSKKDLKRGYYDAKGKAAQRAFLRSPLTYTRISSPFGYRKHPILKRKHFHGGIDYAAPKGTPVRAVAEGKVSFAARKGPAGNMVKIRHAGGYESFYLHLSKINVRVGQRVSQSTIIGKVGSTGRSTGPHLDFRLKKHGKYLNPRKHVAPRTKSVPKKEISAYKKSIKKWQSKLTKV
jgi:murein DD-endopeptidase MepM/ murein hydrolase activator NlpD